MFTLIIPNFIFPHASEIPTLNTPALHRIWRFAHTQNAPQSRAHLTVQYLGYPPKLAPNQVFASPICQQMGMNSTTVIAAAHVGITAQEAQQLCQDLNQFYENEYHFAPIRPDLWQLTLPYPATWQADSILNISGVQNGEHIAHGDNRQWLTLSSEIQMFLHQHSINSTRQAPINGVWLWNALPTASHPIAPPTWLASNSAWAHPNSPAIPNDFAAWQHACTQHAQNIATTAVWLDDLSACADMGDVHQYTQILHDWETRWFAPLLRALHMGDIRAFAIVSEQGKWTMNAHSHWAFWRRKKMFG